MIRYVADDCNDQRPPDNGGHLLLKILDDNPRLKHKLDQCGLFIDRKWRPTEDFRSVYAYVSFRRQDTQEQCAIRSLLLEANALWTAEDLACALRKNPRNQRVLGKIRRDCLAIRAHERQVARLWRGKRRRVYCLDPLNDRSLDDIRQQYRAYLRSKKA